MKSAAPLPDAPSASHANVSWRPEVWGRMRHLFALKAIGTTVFTCLFFIGYFQTLQHPSSAVMVMPLTALDHWIAFQPYWIVAYLSLWLYVGAAPGLKQHFAELCVYGLWAAALCLCGLVMFHLWPTQVPPNLASLSSTAPGFALLKGVDAAGNACPSMHVAVAMFTAMNLADTLRRCRAPVALRAANVAWFLAITISTLTTKQHVVLDAMAGACLGAIFGWASLRWPGRDTTVKDWLDRRRRSRGAPDIINRH